MGCKTIYSEELAELICEKISIHTLSLRQLCAKYKEFPAMSTIHRWRREYPDFGKKFLEAKRDQALLFLDDILDIADEAHYLTDINGATRIDGSAVSWQKLRIETRRSIGCMLLPKIFGVTKDEVDNNETLREELLSLREALLQEKKKEF